MKLIGVIFGVVGIVALFIGMWIFGSYNSMISGNENVEAAWAQVETQYQRRFDLVPNLVAATRGVLAQEQEVFGAIAEARTRYAGAAAGSDEKVAATSQYEGALARLLVVMENYPVLKSYESVRTLTDELAGTENRVAVVRDRYNAEVRAWNVNIKRFPRNLIAGMFGFESKKFFESVEAAATAPTVNLELNND